MAYARTNSLSSIESRLLEGDKRLTYWCMLAILHSLFFLLILSFLLLCFCYFFSFLVLTHVVCSDVMILSRGYYCSPTVHGKGPLYTACRDWLLPFQPLTAFGVWMSMPTTIGLSVLQPLPLTRVGCATPHHLTVAFLSTLVWVFSLYSSWYAPSGSNLSLFLLGSILSQQDISPKRT